MARRVAAIAFTYLSLPADLRKDAQSAAERIRALHMASIFETGRELIAIKERLDHGLFVEWVEAELGMSARSAQRCMLAVKELGDKSDKLSFLPKTAIEALVAPSTPPRLKEELVSRIVDHGEKLGRREIVGAVREAKAKEVKTRRVARETPAQRRYRMKAEQKEATYEAERQARFKALKSTAERAVDFLEERLGDDFQAFLAMIDGDPFFYFRDAALARRKAAA